MSKANIREDEHLFVCGKTGFGKSHLAKAYASGFKKVVKLDTKGEALDMLDKNMNPWDNVPKSHLVIVESLDDYIQAYKEGYPYSIYCPNLDEMNPYTYEQFFQFQYIMKNNTTWVDEMMEVEESPANIGHYLKGLYTRGRSRNSNVICCTQRPTGIPQIIFSMSSHIFAFTTNLAQDREKLIKFTGVKEFEILPEKYYFWYWRDGWEKAELGILR